LVSVDGRVVTDVGQKVDPASCKIAVRGRPVSLRVKTVCWLVNKPKGVVCTCSDPQGRPTVLQLVRRSNVRLFPVGRLDYDSQGLLLLTNDGEIAQILTHPRYGIEKEYVVKVRGIPSEKTLERLVKGLRLPDGKARARRVSPVSSTGRNAWLRVVVCEGRKRLIRRMFEALGHPVVKLTRTRIFYLKLGDIPPGGAVLMDDAQVEILKRRCRKIAAAVEGGR